MSTAVAFLERFENKKEDIKQRLNHVVDDLFAYLSVEFGRLALSDQVVFPNNSITTTTTTATTTTTTTTISTISCQPVISVIEHHHHQNQHHNHQNQNPIQHHHNSSPASVAIDLHHYHHHHQQQQQQQHQTNHANTFAIANTGHQQTSLNIKEEIEENICEPISQSQVQQLLISNKKHLIGSENTSLTEHYNSESSPEKCNIECSPSPDVHVPSTSSCSGTVAGLSVNQMNDDDEDEYEHSDSDCDCEQCMGVPICKVDIDDDIHEEMIDRPSSKKKKISLNDTAVNYHDGDDGEQCSATFKTLSIKCSQDDCPSMFKNKIERNQHLLYVHGILPYTCLMNGCKLGFDNVSVII